MLQVAAAAATAAVAAAANSVQFVKHDGAL